MHNFLKKLYHFFFKKPAAALMAKETIEDYERELLVAENTAAYNKKLAEFYKEAIQRLRQQHPSYWLPSVGT